MTLIVEREMLFFWFAAVKEREERGAFGLWGQRKESCNKHEKERKQMGEKDVFLPLCLLISSFLVHLITYSNPKICFKNSTIFLLLKKNSIQFTQEELKKNAEYFDTKSGPPLLPNLKKQTHMPLLPPLRSPNK